MMNKRVLEVAAVVAVVAGVVAYGGMPDHLTDIAQASTATPVPKATTLPQGVASPVFAQAAERADSSQYAIWKSLYQESQGYLGQGDNAKAEARLVEALKLAPTAGLEAEHQTLDDLGLVCYRLGEYDRCAQYQKRAIDAAKKVPEPQRSAVVGLYETRLATALEALGQHLDALAALGRARVCYMQAYSAGSPAYSEAMNNLAAQYRTLGDNDSAAKLLEDL